MIDFKNLKIQCNLEISLVVYIMNYIVIDSDFKCVFPIFKYKQLTSLHYCIIFHFIYL